jgi:hypothetical protein
VQCTHPAAIALFLFWGGFFLSDLTRLFLLRTIARDHDLDFLLDGVPGGDPRHYCLPLLLAPPPLNAAESLNDQQ